MKKETKPSRSSFNNWFGMLQMLFFPVSVIILALTLKGVSKISEKAPLKKELEVNQSSFNESQDRDYVDWKRVRSAIEHENTLVHYRLTWFSSLQTFLFAAFGVILGLVFKDPSRTLEASEFEFDYILVALIVIFVIIFLGMSTSVAIWRALLDARRQIRNLDCWWHEDNRSRLVNENYWSRLTKRYQRESVRVKKLAKHPLLQISESKFWIGGPIGRFFNYLISSYCIPCYFFLGWLVFLVVWVWLLINVVHIHVHR